MISCTEAIANFEEHARQVALAKIEATNKCIEDTKEWCNTVLSQMIEEGSKKGNRRVILKIAHDYCPTEGCDYLLRDNGYLVEHARIINTPMLLQIAYNHGFKVKVKETTFSQYCTKKYSSPVDGKEYYIEWA